jgi:HEAT repeat protein
MAKSLICIPALLISCCVLSASQPKSSQIDEMLLASNDARARAILIQGLESSDFAIRIQAITALSMVGSHDAMVERLEESLQDRNVKVRLAAVRALADLKSPDLKDGLHKSLAEDNAPEVSFAAAKALAGLEVPRERWL